MLDVAGGAGYSAALLSGLAGEVVALESEPELAALARANLAKVGATQVRVECGPLDQGVPAAAPFDVILIHGAVECGLDALFEQLTPNGHLLAYRKLDEDFGMKVVWFERSEASPPASGPCSTRRRLCSLLSRTRPGLRSRIFAAARADASWRSNS